MKGYDFFDIYGDSDDFYKSESERDSLKNNRTDINYDIGDHLRYIGASILGRGDEFSYETMKKKVTDAENERLQKLNQNLRNTILEGDALRGIQRTEADLKLKKGDDVDEHRNKLEREAATTQFIAEKTAQYPNINFQGVKTQGEALALIKKHEKEQNDLFGPEAVLERERRREMEKDRRYYDERADERRADMRKYELEILRLQQADKQKAQDRKDRMFMTLMSGLQNLGQGFTI